MCINQKTGPSQPSVLSPQPSESGVSLIELIMFIVIISIAVAGVMLVMNRVTGHSADALVRKQALAVAESLLEEVELMPFTYCDPDDANAASAVSATDCTPGLSQNVITGPTPGTETRYAAAPFDNVADYSTFNMSPILDITGNGVGLASYTANVAIARAGTALGLPADDAALLITVTADHPSCDIHPCITLNGYRTRYAPNALP